MTSSSSSRSSAITFSEQHMPHISFHNRLSLTKFPLLCPSHSDFYEFKFFDNKSTPEAKTSQTWLSSTPKLNAISHISRACKCSPWMNPSLAKGSSRVRKMNTPTNLSNGFGLNLTTFPTYIFCIHSFRQIWMRRFSRGNALFKKLAELRTFRCNGVQRRPIKSAPALNL